MFSKAEGLPLGSLSRRATLALAMLCDGACCAEETSSNLWEYAVEIHELLQLGLTKNDLRLLVKKGYAKHKKEITPIGCNRRRFEATGEAVFTSRTCFVVSPVGLHLVRNLPPPKVAPQKAPAIGPAMPRLPVALPPAQSTPVWIAKEKLLLFDGHVIKHFIHPPAKQGIILSSFQELGWPLRIDDPLPPIDGIDSKRHLNDVIKCLNRNHCCQLIRFGGDGTGEGVVWERLP